MEEEMAPVEPKIGELIASFSGLVAIATFCVQVGTKVAVESDFKKERSQLDIKKGWDAIKMPIEGSILLISLYYAHKFLSEGTFIKIINTYFGIALASSIQNFFAPYVLKVLKEPVYNKVICHFSSEKHPLLTKFLVKIKYEKPIEISILLGDLISLIIGLCFTMPYSLRTKNNQGTSILMSDIIAIFLAISSMSEIKLDSWKIGVLMLFGLMLYDILWVFGIRIQNKSGSSVMEVVARNVKVPIKILLPKNLRNILKSTNDPSANSSMLGLGDIIIPGLFLATCRRISTSMTLPNGKPFTALYRVGIIGYVIALLCTGLSLFITHTGQPALLFISPILIISTAITAIIYKRWQPLLMWKASDQIVEDSEDGDKLTIEQDVLDEDQKKSVLEEEIDKANAKLTKDSTDNKD